MFVLLAVTHYEGADVIGVYTTLEKAQLQAKVYFAMQPRFWADEVEVYQRVADAPFVKDSDPVWSLKKEEVE
jgi:hypothetical protein